MVEFKNIERDLNERMSMADRKSYQKLFLCHHLWRQRAIEKLKKSGDDDKMFDMFIAQERRIQFSKRRLSFLQAMIRGNELENQNHWRRMARNVV